MAMEYSISSSISSSIAVDKLEGLTLRGVTPVEGEMGRGAYGRVFKVKYFNTFCAAKEIHELLVEGVTEVETRRTVDMFMRECYRCSLLRHPNIVQFLGIYRPTQDKLPVMVMEMMADSLTSLVDKHEKIPVHIKYSIVHDVSLGLCYLHNHDPPIVHRDLSPNNILLTAHHVAKISDLGVAKVIKADSRKTMTKAPGTVDFMPPEALDDLPFYGPSLDVFSFAGIILHTFNQQWPKPSSQAPFNPASGERKLLTELERRQQYLDKMTGQSEALIPLVKECLYDDPSVRPRIDYICNIIETAKKSYLKRFSSSAATADCMSLHREVEQLTTEKQLLVTRNREIETQLTYKQFETKEEGDARMPGFCESTPPIVAALKTTRYKMKWTELAKLPVPLSETYAAFSDRRIYVTACTSSFEDAAHQVFVYDCPTNKWYQLPPSGHYYGVPHIIGGKLAIIGGRLTETSQRTNKVSTFDKLTHQWTSFYPDMLSVRSRPGVTTYLEYVIVAGGMINDNKCSNDIEVLNWIENCPWMKVSTLLPFPMYAFSPTVANEQFYIVGFSNSEWYNSTEAYSIPVEKLISLFTKRSSSWNKLSQYPYVCSSLAPGLSTPLAIGGHTFDHNQKVSTQNMYLYGSNKDWKQVGRLISPRSQSAVISINNNSIIIIGGSAYMGVAGNHVGQLATVELGQVELVCETAL